MSPQEEEQNEREEKGSQKSSLVTLIIELVGGIDSLINIFATNQLKVFSKDQQQCLVTFVGHRRNVSVMDIK